MNKEAENYYFSEADMISAVVSQWTKEAGTMLPKEPAEIEEIVKYGTYTVVWGHGGEPIGFGAVTFEWPKNWIELGAVVVDTKHREKGVGHAVVKALIDKAKSVYHNVNMFALCNEKSLKLFLDNGGEIITNPNILPKEVFGECINCPKFKEAKSKGMICCDTPVLIQKYVKPEPLGCCR